jgi:UDP-glucose 4-epimerase
VFFGHLFNIIFVPMNKTIIVTGGCGYIGSHTIVDLIENGYDVISIDNNSRSNAIVLDGIKKITGVSVKNYKVDLCNFEETHAIFLENDNIYGIIHFAAYKAVGESVEQPLAYYNNNVNSLINILRCADEFNVSNFVYSSSCTVYGSPEVIQVTEDTPLQKAASPYGYTKQIGEEMIQNTLASVVDMKAVILRYFNPVGAHPSIEIGETPLGKPQNLVPGITQTAIGILPEMNVWGNDYDTKDGTCVRDYIHVSDIAHAHTLAIQYLEKNTEDQSFEVFNLGTGTGITVMEAITAFEKVSNTKLNYKIAERRPGDVVAIYANNEKARKILGWQTKFSLDEMMLTAWKWEQNRIIYTKQ